MADKRIKEVELYAESLKSSRKFPIGQATEILNMNRPEWELKDDKYEFKDGNIIERTGGAANKGTGKQKRSK